MSVMDAGIIGAVIAVLLIIAGKALMDLHAAIKEAICSFNLMRSATEDSVMATRAATQANERVLREMVLVRQMTIGGPAEGEQEAYQTLSPQREASERVPLKYTPFPDPMYDRFPVKPEEPDASLDDTDRELLEQTDQQLSEAETLEALRARGVDVEPGDTLHRGIVVEA